MRERATIANRRGYAKAYCGLNALRFAASAARHRYQAAMLRQGAQASPSAASALGFGCSSSPAATFQPEVASLNLGSMNFGLFGMLDRFKDLKHQWERDYLGNKDIIFRNTFGQIEHILTTCGPNGTKFEFECYDTAHLYNLKYFFDRGLVQAPLFIQTVFGLQGGIGAHPDDVMHMKRTADRLFGDAYRWSVLGAGRHQMPLAAMAAAMGGNVRVGLEDSLWIGPGRLARSNAEQVRQVRQIIEGLGMEAATPDEAREILALKGGDKVAF